MSLEDHENAANKLYLDFIKAYDKVFRDILVK